MVSDFDRLLRLASIIEKYLPETVASSGNSLIDGPTQQMTRLSVGYAQSIAYSYEYGARLFGHSENRIEPRELARKLLEARSGITELDDFDRHVLSKLTYPDAEELPDADRIEKLISELAKLENAVRSSKFKKSRGQPAGGQRKWRAMAVAYACVRVWEAERGPASAPKAVSLDKPPNFGVFVNEVLVWAGERHEHNGGASATTALRSLSNWYKSQQ